MGCGFESVIVLAIGAGGTEPGVVIELEMSNVAPGIFIPFFGDGNVAGGVAVVFGVATGVLGGVGSGQVGSIDIGFFAVVVYPAPALVADAGSLDGFAVAQRANDHIVGAGAGADIDRGDGIYGFHNIHKGFNRRFCRNFGGEGGICVGSFRCRRLGFCFCRFGRCLGFLRGGGGCIRVVGGCGRAICGPCGAFGRTGGFDGAGFSGIFLAGDTASEGGHHADDQEQGQGFLECVVFHR